MTTLLYRSPPPRLARNNDSGQRASVPDLVDGDAPHLDGAPDVSATHPSIP